MPRPVTTWAVGIKGAAIWNLPADGMPRLLSGTQRIHAGFLSALILKTLGKTKEASD